MFTDAHLPMPALLVAWAAMGLAAAYVASAGMKDRLYLVADSIAGVLGGVAGGLAACLIVRDSAVLLGSFGAAFLGAWAVIFVAHAAAARRRI
jgi:hypothetical protein